MNPELFNARLINHVLSVSNIQYIREHKKYHLVNYGNYLSKLYDICFLAL